jgi:hypothetical protein
LPEDYSTQDVEALQKDVYAVLNDLAIGRSAKIFSPEEFDLRLRFSATAIRKRPSVVFAYGPTRDAFLWKLFLLIAQEPADRILRCKAPDCEKIFYRQRNQEFCSKRCGRRIYMRDKREADPSYRESEKEDAHARYKERISKIDPDREVKRRPRKKG